MSKKKEHKPTSKFDPSKPDSLRGLDEDTLIGVISRLYEQNKQLSELMQSFLRDKYGPKTEHFKNPDQLALFNDENAAENESALQEQSSQKSDAASEIKPKKKKGHGRNPRPSHLKHVTKRGAEPSAEALKCNCCSNSVRKKVNEVIRGSRYAYQPSNVCVEEFVAMIFACSNCGDSLVVEPDVPPAALKVEADSSLLAAIAVDRFADHMPLYRQEQKFARIGVSLNRSTMCGWLAFSATLLRPVWNHAKKLLLNSRVIETDDTPMKVQDRSKKKNIKIGRIWTYRGDRRHPFNLFDYTDGRGRAGPLYFLQGFKGFLLGDCFSGNQAICAESGAIHVACHAHARRYFIKAEPNNKVACAAILDMYSELFKIENDARDLELDDSQLKLMREQESKPILEKMYSWLQQHSVTALPKSSFGKAVNYCLNNWIELNNYLLDGELRIDNNLAEQEMKRAAISRKNSLFFGSDKGGENAEVFMSLISTCRRHNVEPWSYLKDVIDRLMEDPSSDLDQLLPNNWCPKFNFAEINGSLCPPKIPSIVLH
jgi:transposase